LSAGDYHQVIAADGDGRNEENATRGTAFEFLFKHSFQPSEQIAMWKIYSGLFYKQA